MQISSAKGDLSYYLINVLLNLDATSIEARIADGARIINMAFAAKEVAVAA